MELAAATSDAIVVTVPVRNEAQRLPALLAALAAQRGAPPFALLLLLDGCEDRSAAVIAERAPGQPYDIRVHRCAGGCEPNAGLARARAADLAIAGLADGILLTTDADSTPHPDWIAANLAALARADVVAGRILRPGACSPLQDRVESYYDRLHCLRRTIDPVSWEDGDTHHWTSGASLGMRIATCRQLGGFRPLPHGEDADLTDRASRLGLRVRRDARVVVSTSARRQGRARGGFAAALSALDKPGAMPLLAHPEDEVWRYRHHALARALFAAPPRADFAGALRLPLAELAQVAAEARNGEAFAARIVGAPPGGMRTVSLASAEIALTMLEAPSLEGAA